MSYDIDLAKLIEIHPVRFIGGSSLLLKDLINARYRSTVNPNLVSEDALLANIKGFYKFGKLKYNKELSE